MYASIIMKTFNLYFIFVVLSFSSCSNDENESENGYAVDLGLSVKWATCNVGAKSPEGIGGYYIWGNVDDKKNSADDIHMSDSQGYIKYNDTDNLLTLESKDDVARARLGKRWRMPTKQEWEELIRECYWTWTVQNGMAGFVVKSSNGNYIFLPAAGYKNDEELYGYTRLCVYWSSSRYSNGDYAWRMDLNERYFDVYDSPRYYMAQVRAVCE